MDADAALGRLLHLARDAGDRAAASIQQIATRNAHPASTGSTWRRRLGSPVTADQVRRACTELDEFARCLADLDTFLDRQGVPGRLSDRIAGASDELWVSTGSAAAVYERLATTLADVERLRIASILGRPFERPAG